MHLHIQSLKKRGLKVLQAARASASCPSLSGSSLNFHVLCLILPLFFFFFSFILFVFFKQCSYLGVTAIGTAVEALQACCPEQQ